MFVSRNNSGLSKSRLTPHTKLTNCHSFSFYAGTSRFPAVSALIE